MAGLYERIHPDGTDRLAVHYLEATMELYAHGVVTNRTVIKNNLDATLQSELTTAEDADLDAILNAIDSETGVGSKSLYARKATAACIAVEAVGANESFWRNALGIA